MRLAFFSPTCSGVICGFKGFLQHSPLFTWQWSEDGGNGGRSGSESLGWGGMWGNSCQGLAEGEPFPTHGQRLLFLGSPDGQWTVNIYDHLHYYYYGHILLCCASQILHFLHIERSGPQWKKSRQMGRKQQENKSQKWSLRLGLSCCHLAVTREWTSEESGFLRRNLLWWGHHEDCWKANKELRILHKLNWRNSSRVWEDVVQ